MLLPTCLTAYKPIIIWINITHAVSTKATFLSCLSSFVIWAPQLCICHRQSVRGSLQVFLLVHFCLLYFVDGIYKVSSFIIKSEIHAFLTTWRNYGNTDLSFLLSIYFGLVFLSTQNVAVIDSNMIKPRTCSHHFSTGFPKLFKRWAASCVTLFAFFVFFLWTPEIKINIGLPSAPLLSILSFMTSWSLAQTSSWVRNYFRTLTHQRSRTHWGILLATPVLKR